jgi:hypothetical protein
VQITSGPTATVSFRPFSRTALAAVQTVRGRRWNEANKRWEIPVGKVTDLVDRLVAGGEAVQVNGREWSPSNPLMALFKALPVRLRQPAYDALEQALAGDREWMTRLQQAHTQHGSESRRRAS